MLDELVCKRNPGGHRRIVALTWVQCMGEQLKPVDSRIKTNQQKEWKNNAIERRNSGKWNTNDDDSDDNDDTAQYMCKDGENKWKSKGGQSPENNSPLRSTRSLRQRSIGSGRSRRTGDAVVVRLHVRVATFDLREHTGTKATGITSRLSQRIHGQGTY